AYNEEHGIMPLGIQKSVRDITDQFRVAEDQPAYTTAAELPRDELARMVRELETQMKNASRDLEFERAAQLRDQIIELRRELVDNSPESLKAFGGGGPAVATSPRPQRSNRRGRMRR